MYRNDYVIYAKKGDIDGVDQANRIEKVTLFVVEQLDVINEFREENGEQIQRKRAIIETSPRRFGDLKKYFSYIFRDNRPKPTLVVWKRDDIWDDPAIEMLLKYRISVIIAAELPDIDPADFDPDQVYIDRGPVLDHIVEFQVSMRRHEDGSTEKKQPNMANMAERAAAQKEADLFWLKIKKTAKAFGLTTQKELAAHFQQQGIKTRDGEPITQPYIATVLKRAGKREDWKKLKAEIKRQPKLNLQSLPKAPKKPIQHR
jgi:hypothetical protein